MAEEIAGGQRPHAGQAVGAEGFQHGDAQHLVGFVDRLILMQQVAEFFELGVAVFLEGIAGFELIEDGLPEDGGGLRDLPIRKPAATSRQDQPS